MTNIFELDKSRVFVSGLFWQPLSGMSSDRHKETKRLAEELNFDLAVWRTTAAHQVGLGSTAKGMKPGYLSAAAVISKTLEMEFGARDFLCATEIPGGLWLYVSQREGVILPDGDFIGGEDEVRSRLLEDMSVGVWRLIFAPEHWGIGGAEEERSFAEFLPKKAGKRAYMRWWGLRPVSRFRSIRVNSTKSIAFLLLLMMVIGGAFYAYKSHKDKEMAEAIRIANLSATQPVVKPEHPWKKAPRALKYLESCRAALKEVIIWPGNWSPQSATCSNDTLTLLWKKQEHGWIEHLLRIEPKAVISMDGATASVSVPLILGKGEDEALVKETVRTIGMHSAAQRYRFSFTVEPAARPSVLPGQEQGTPTSQDWRETKWSATGSLLPPEVVLGALNGDGFRVNTIQVVFAPGSFVWNMEGAQYVQP